MNHTNEDAVIRRCLGLGNAPQDASALKFLCQKALDWDYILRTAREEGLSPVIYHSLKKHAPQFLPPEVSDSLKNAYLSTALRNEHFLNELEEVLQAAQEIKIPVILLKGIALIKTVYKDVAFRPMGDIDIFIPADRLVNFEEAVFRLGYSADQTAPFYYIKKSRFSVPLDVHTDIRYLESPQDIWQSALSIRLNKVQAKVMRPEDQIIYLASHASIHHGNISRLQLLDISQTLKVNSGQISWPGLAQKIIKYNIGIPLYHVFKRLRDYLEVDVPASFLDKIYCPGKRRIEKSFYALVLNSAPQADIGHILHFFICRGIRHKIGYVISFLFPPRGFMLRRYKIKNSCLVYLYYPYRLASHAIRTVRVFKRLFWGILDKDIL